LSSVACSEENIVAQIFEIAIDSFSSLFNDDISGLLNKEPGYDRIWGGVRMLLFDF
jgi:hypothetical protein